MTASWIWPNAASCSTLMVWIAAVVFWFNYGFHEFKVITDMQLAGLIILGVGLLESGRLLTGLNSGAIGNYDRATSPRMYRWNIAVLALAVLLICALGGSLVLFLAVRTYWV